MQLDKFIAGLNLLSTYFDKPDGYNIGADHDIVYVYATDRPVSEEGVKKLRELGWVQVERDEDDPYDPEQGWSAHT